jgi:hypothetical protein
MIDVFAELNVYLLICRFIYSCVHSLTRTIIKLDTHLTVQIHDLHNIIPVASAQTHFI